MGDRDPRGLVRDILREIAIRGLAPGHSHAYVALEIAYQKKGDLPRAKEYAMRALAADPRNPVALKNLGAIFSQEGDSLKALYYLRRSFEIDPHDPQTVYCLAFACMELGDIERAQKHSQMVLEMEAPEDLRGLARNGLPEIAVWELKARGARMHAVFYPAGRCWRGCSWRWSWCASCSAEGYRKLATARELSIRSAGRVALIGLQIAGQLLFFDPPCIHRNKHKG